MNTTRFVIAAVVIAALVIVSGIAFIKLKPTLSASPPDFTDECTQLRQYELVTGFKKDVLVFGVLGAIGAGISYYFTLRYQLFFPGSDIWRLLISVLSGIGLAFPLTFIDTRWGPECLSTAIGPGSAIWEEVAKIQSLAGAGLGVGNVWLAVFLDQLFLALIGVALVRLSRWSYLRLYSFGD